MGDRVGGSGQDGCERSIEVFVKIQKKIHFGGGGGVGSGGGGQGRCEQRSEVSVKIKQVAQRATIAHLRALGSRYYACP